MRRRELVLLVLLSQAALLVVAGVALWSIPAGLVTAGLLLGVLTVVAVAETTGGPGDESS